MKSILFIKWSKIFFYIIIIAIIAVTISMLLSSIFNTHAYADTFIMSLEKDLLPTNEQSFDELVQEALKNSSSSNWEIRCRLHKNNEHDFAAYGVIENCLYSEYLKHFSPIEGYQRKQREFTPNKKDVYWDRVEIVNTKDKSLNDAAYTKNGWNEWYNPFTWGQGDYAYIGDFDNEDDLQIKLYNPIFESCDIGHYFRNTFEYKIDYFKLLVKENKLEIDDETEDLRECFMHSCPYFVSAYDQCTCIGSCEISGGHWTYNMELENKNITKVALSCVDPNGYSKKNKKISELLYDTEKQCFYKDIRTFDDGWVLRGSISGDWDKELMHDHIYYSSFYWDKVELINLSKKDLGGDINWQQKFEDLPVNIYCAQRDDQSSTKKKWQNFFFSKFIVNEAETEYLFSHNIINCNGGRLSPLFFSIYDGFNDVESTELSTKRQNGLVFFDDTQKFIYDHKKILNKNTVLTFSLEYYNKIDIEDSPVKEEKLFSRTLIKYPSNWPYKEDIHKDKLGAKLVGSINLCSEEMWQNHFDVEGNLYYDKISWELPSGMSIIDYFKKAPRLINVDIPFQHNSVIQDRVSLFYAKNAQSSLLLRIVQPEYTFPCNDKISLNNKIQRKIISLRELYVSFERAETNNYFNLRVKADIQNSIQTEYNKYNLITDINNLVFTADSKSGIATLILSDDTQEISITTAPALPPAYETIKIAIYSKKTINFSSLAQTKYGKMISVQKRHNINVNNSNYFKYIINIDFSNISESGDFYHPLDKDFAFSEPGTEQGFRMVLDNYKPMFSFIGTVYLYNPCLGLQGSSDYLTYRKVLCRLFNIYPESEDYQFCKGQSIVDFIDSEEYDADYGFIVPDQEKKDVYSIELIDGEDASICYGKIKVKVGSNYDLSDIEKDYPDLKTNSFCGWYPDISLNDNQITNNSVVESNGPEKLYAKWVHNSIFLLPNINNTYSNSINEKIFLKIKQNFNSSIKVPTVEPTMKNYAFQGWYTDPDFKCKIDSSILFQDSRKTVYYYAKFSDLNDSRNTETLPTLCFNAGRGTFSGSNKTTIDIKQVQNKKITFPKTIPEPQNNELVFIGWYYSSNSGMIFLTPDSIYSKELFMKKNDVPVSVYACYGRSTNIYFYFNGGKSTLSSNSEVFAVKSKTYNDIKDILTCNICLNGRQLEGWYDLDGNKYELITNSSNQMSLTITDKNFNVKEINSFNEQTFPSFLYCKWESDDSEP